MKDIPYLVSEQKRITKLVIENFKKYYLTGGTALSFYLGHRFSEDLDFFTHDYKREDPKKIMEFIKQKTSFEFEPGDEQDDPKLIPMRIFYLGLKDEEVLKIDFVQDYTENIEDIKNGVHSKRDIYYRKLISAVGLGEKESELGRFVPTGRQEAKDLYDIYCLSTEFEPLSEFFFEYFSYDKAERLVTWYKLFNRTNLKFELLDLVENIDIQKILKVLDDEILKKIPDKLIS